MNKCFTSDYWNVSSLTHIVPFFCKEQNVLGGAAQAGSVELFDWLVSRFNLPPDASDDVSAFI